MSLKDFWDMKPVYFVCVFPPCNIIIKAIFSDNNKPFKVKFD